MRMYLIGTVAALGLATTTAMAQSTVGGGAAASGPDGSVAGGASAGTARADQGTTNKREKRGRHEQRRDRDATANSSTTYGAGSVYTDRNRATGGVTAGGTASGTGSQSSSTSVDAYGATDRNGSTGEVYGDSSATSTNPRQ